MEGKFENWLEIAPAIKSGHSTGLVAFDGQVTLNFRDTV